MVDKEKKKENKNEKEKEKEAVKIQIKDEKDKEISKLIKELEEVKSQKKEKEQQYESLLGKIGIMKNIFSKLKEEAAQSQKKQEEFEREKEKQQEMVKQMERLEREHEEEKYRSMKQNQEHLRVIRDMKAEQQQEIETLKQSILEKYKQNEQLQILLREKIDEFETYKTKYNNDKLSYDVEKQKMRQESEESKILIAQMEQRILEFEDVIRDNRQQIEDLNCEKNSVNVKQMDEFKETLFKKDKLIGELRHELAVLNENLKESFFLINKYASYNLSVIDIELISNLILKFLLFSRSDTKKFESLNLISLLLKWDDKTKIEAGLINSKNLQKNIVPNFLKFENNKNFSNELNELLNIDINKV